MIEIKQIYNNKWLMCNVVYHYVVLIVLIKKHHHPLVELQYLLRRIVKAFTCIVKKLLYHLGQWFMVLWNMK